jgi:hypothetical protein
MSTEHVLTIYSIDIESQKKAIELLDSLIKTGSVIVVPKPILLIKFFKIANKIHNCFRENNAFYVINDRSIKINCHQSLLEEAKKMVQKELNKIVLTKESLNLTNENCQFLFKKKVFFDLCNRLNLWIDIPEINFNPILTLERDLNSNKKLRLVLCHGDIKNFSCDFMVNSVNEYMTHGDGVAKAIADEAGIDYKKQCQDLINRRGQLQTNLPAINYKWG